MTDLTEKSIHTLELPKVLALLADEAVSAPAKASALELRPVGDPYLLARWFAEVADAKTLYRKGLAAEYLEERRALIRTVNRRGAFCMETGADRFAAEAVNRYLRICSSRRI